MVAFIQHSCVAEYDDSRKPLISPEEFSVMLLEHFLWVTFVTASCVTASWAPGLYRLT